MDTSTSTTTANKPKEVKKSEKQDKGGSKSGIIALFLTLLLSLGAIGYLFYENNLVKEQNQAQMARIDSLTGVKNGLLKDIETKKDEIIKIQGEKEGLDTTLSNALRDLDARKAKIGQLQFKISKQKNLAGDIKKLEEEKAGFLKRIQELEEMLAAAKAEIEQLKSANLELNQQLGNLQSKNLTLEKKVELAAALKTSNVLIIGEKKGKGGKYVPSALKKATRLLVTFELIENKVAEPGQKEIYVKVTNPKGKVIENSESGSFTNPDNNISTPYTTLYKVNYNNSEQMVSIPIEINKEDKLPGSYNLEFFCEGNLIGAKNITVK